MTMSTAYKGVQCHKYTRGRCDESHFIKLDKLTKMVMDKIKSDFEKGSFDTIIQKSESKAIAEKSELQKRMERANNKLSRVKEAYQAGIDTLDEYKENKKKIQREIEMIRNEMLLAPTVARNTAEELKKIIGTNLTVLNSNTPEELKNDVLHSFIDKIIFDRKNASVSIVYYV